MGPFYRLLGLMAFVDEILGSVRFYYIIRCNWILFATIGLYFFAGASALGLPWPRLPFEIPLAYPGLQTALTLLVICWFKRDMIFRPMGIVTRGDGASRTPVTVPPDQVDLRISGRFDRGLGHSLTLRDIPVRWNVDHTGSTPARNLSPKGRRVRRLAIASGRQRGAMESRRHPRDAGRRRRGGDVLPRAQGPAGLPTQAPGKANGRDPERQECLATHDTESNVR